MECLLSDAKTTSVLPVVMPRVEMDSSLNFLLSPRILERLFFTRVVLGQISNTKYPKDFSHLNNTTDAGLRLASFDGAA